MQSTFDIKLSNVRFRDQTIKQIKSRVNFNKKHQMTQLKTQNQLNSNHDQIRFKFVVFQNRFFFMQKVEIFIQKQFVVRHHLFQYIVDEKYVKCTHWINEKYEKFLIQNYVSHTMFRKSIIFSFSNDIVLWRTRNKSINEKKTTHFHEIMNCEN